ncbi:conserved domain protein [Chlamydia pneumoniae LPCoLN]|uniref:hypothetical protein n=1 Tax=Chlamydia pneumoniae TaxID=83558 RepID=UPI0001BD9D7A|nr:hypothetical protein [Chlamydia pneumoniae]ACZ33128.1 conserved domain protein [Chlamydia pneumoniae LPCoLN]ETR80030.1 hypothetical protein X556_0642 [Chlamydia pneumoniae B21]
MSCSEVVFQTVHGLGFGGLSSKSVVPFKKSLSDAPRVVCSILVLILGLGALVCGIAITCWYVPGVILMGGICAIVLGVISLTLSLFWLWGLFANCCGSKRVSPCNKLSGDDISSIALDDFRDRDRAVMDFQWHSFQNRGCKP